MIPKGFHQLLHFAKVILCLMEAFVSLSNVSNQLLYVVLRCRGIETSGVLSVGGYGKGISTRRATGTKVKNNLQTGT